MALLNILHYPDERLHTVAKPVEVFDEALQTQIDNMFETMYEAKGIGLAATQVDFHRRLVVMDISEERNERRVFINPEILSKDGETVYEEGCLSVPGIYDKVTRAEHVKVRALDRNGKPFELEADGLLAICIQHEIDHLDGKVFVEYLSQMKQTRIKSKLKKREKQNM
ncbi:MULTISPECIES: peptide deformylase [Chromobacterium]|uniref:Peptide deformylase n=3 Tax=Chromobacterium TaxID=535 RepID=A0ABS3GNM0_9NEIS|nr:MULTISPECIES: peptide deformylase [Chromobacterium]AXT44967.1 peptide deformylase [Chromobacterium rhizoryzae]MBK0414801.1 peptide deformylase [Chromobacterium haemolyticum]MBO0416180.1 peptide deformylase [Chromobacterium haemolyticum]MBO0499321.1 peptide deformylase [Chromobacterium haemolyticum]MDH0342615.1 peptide deformylase [Chromobacterium haemolyticum]